MHICVPDTREVRPQSGSSYLLYNIHIDGLYHCSLRYKQLLHLHQLLCKSFPTLHYRTSQFPPKKILPLSSAQVEERRVQLEKYLQCISQDRTICNSSIFNLFFLKAQRESTRINRSQVHIDIELVNGQKIRLQIVSHDSADAVLTAVCRALGLDDKYDAYFCLCLCGYDVIRDKLIIKRKLSSFESPFITLQMAIQQQEQLQAVLSSSSETLIKDNNNIEGNNCHCLSCTTKYDDQQYTYNRQSTTSESPPLVDTAPTYGPSAGSSTAGSHLINCNSSNRNNFITNSSGSNSNDNNNNHGFIEDGNSYLCTQTTTTHHQPKEQQTYHDHHYDHPSSCSSSPSTRPNNDSYQNCNTRSQWPNQTITMSSSSASSSSTFVTHRILLRKSYWDPVYDTYILNDQQALNLLFIQTVYDIKHSLMFVDRDIYHRLESLLATDSKMEYILLARTLKYYNYVHFEPCYSDYPKPRTKVMISIGSKELNMRVLNTPTPKSLMLSSPSILLSSTNDPATGTNTINSSNSINNNDNDNDINGSNNDNNNNITETINGTVRDGSWATSGTNLESSSSYSSTSSSSSATNSLNSHHQSQKSHIRPSMSHLQGPGQTSSSAPCGSMVASCSQQSAADGGIKLAAGSRCQDQILYCSSSLVPRSLQHLITKDDLIKEEYNFKVPLIRCWRLTSLETLNSNLPGDCFNSHSNQRQPQRGKSLSLLNTLIGNPTSRRHRDTTANCHRILASGTNGHSLVDAMNNNQHGLPVRCCAGCPLSSPNGQFSQYELSFEYLMSKDNLRWITISSDQAIFISISLQGVVDELVSKRDGLATSNLTASDPLLQELQLEQQERSRNQNFTYLLRDGTTKTINAENQPLIDRLGAGCSPAPNPYALAMGRQRQRQQQQTRGLIPFLSPSSGPSSSFLAGTSPNTSMGLLRGSRLSSLVGLCQENGSISQSANCSLEISNLKKAPSPIINDAFEGVTNEDDL